MPTTIKDGTGRGNSVEVTDSNKLMTLSVTEGIAAHHAFEGDAYNINTGTITLTTASKSALLYIKNLEDEDLILTGLFYLIGNSNTSGGDTLVQLERNPTGGTVVSAGTSFDPINRNFGSSKTLNVTCEKGAEGKTLTGGTVAVESIFSGPGRKFVNVGAIIIPRGSSMGITVTPQTNNTSQAFQIAVACYKVQESTLER